jgi:hypothetical protein
MAKQKPYLGFITEAVMEELGQIERKVTNSPSILSGPAIIENERAGCLADVLVPKGHEDTSPQSSGLLQKGLTTRARVDLVTFRFPQACRQMKYLRGNAHTELRGAEGPFGHS